jgi:hypothetical protein
MDPNTTKRDAINTGLSIQDSELKGPAPRLETNNSLAKLGLGTADRLLRSSPFAGVKCLVRVNRVSLIPYQRLPLYPMNRQVTARRHLSKVPYPDSCIAAKVELFDHLVGVSERDERHGDAERLRS